MGDEDERRLFAGDLVEQAYDLAARARVVEVGRRGLPWVQALPPDVVQRHVLHGLVLENKVPDAVEDRLAVIDLDAAVAVRALTESGPVAGAHLLSGPQSLTQLDKVRILGEALGAELSFDAVAPEQVRAALLAQVGTGGFASVPEACDATIRVVESTVLDPKVKPFYDRAYALYGQLYKDLRQSFKSISTLVNE